MDLYANSIFVLTILIAMVVLQALVASVAHRKQQEYIPGIVNSELDHHSFVFRSHRTFMNSLENVPLFILTAFLAMFANVDATILYWVLITYTAARFIHMVLFYKIATNKNPSPRSYFFMIGLFAQLYLLVEIILTLK